MDKIEIYKGNTVDKEIMKNNINKVKIYFKRTEKYDTVPNARLKIYFPLEIILNDGYKLKFFIKESSIPDFIRDMRSLGYPEVQQFKNNVAVKIY